MGYEVHEEEALTFDREREERIPYVGPAAER